MGILITPAGSAVNNGSGSGPGTSLSAPAYDQAAGHCLVVVTSIFSQITGSATQAPTDTAGNIFTPVYATDNVQINWNSNVYICANCKGNAANVVLETFTGTDTGYSVLDVFDISGAALTNPLDVFLFNYAPQVATSIAATSFSTADANEAILSVVSSAFGNLTLGTQPTGFTKNPAGIPVQPPANFGLSESAYTTVSTIQSDITPGWTSLGVGVAWLLNTLSFIAAPPAPPSVYSVVDSRVTPNTGVTVNGTIQYTGQISDNPRIPPVDSRKAGAPVDSRAPGWAPQNCRTQPPFED